MNNLLLPTILMVVESAIYLFMGVLFDIPPELHIRTLCLYLLFMATYKHFKVRSSLIWDEMRNVAKALLLFIITITLIVVEETLWLTLMTYLLISIIMFVSSISTSRFLRIKYRNIFARKTLVIGIGNDAKRYVDITKNNRFALTDVVAMFTIEKKCDLKELIDINLGRHGTIPVYQYSQLDEVIRENKINQIVVILPEANRDDVAYVMKDLNGKVQHIKHLVEGIGLITFSSIIQDFDGLVLVSTSRDVMNILDRAFKRIVDVSAGIVGCLLVGPIALCIKYKYVKEGDKSPIIFKQERIGKNGKMIKIYKFRTMIPNAETVLEELMEKDPDIKREYLQNKKLRNDPRITKIGNKLRSTSLDEFPQFINVIKGEMSLVGPRPYLFREKDDMDVYYKSIISCKPGITGMWQANGRSDVGFEDRCKLDDFYYKNWSISLDFIIIYKTIKSVLYGKGAL